MIFAGDFFNEDMRRSLRQTVGLTVPASHADLVVDLSCHAAAQSLDRLEQLVLSHPDERVNITASSIAVSLLINRLKELRDAMHEMAKEHGMPVYKTTVQVPL